MRRVAFKVDVGRFIGLGEMNHHAPARAADSVEQLMGTKAEARFAFITDKAEFASDEMLDV